MFLNNETPNQNPLPIPAILGLDQMPSRPKKRDRFFYKSPIIAQRLSLLKNMVGGHSMVIVIIGERGSGKTTLMNEFMFTRGNHWHPCRIKLKSNSPNADKRWQNLNHRIVYQSQKGPAPSIMIDDAHQLSTYELKRLLFSAYSKEGQRKFQSIVLFAEPRMRERFAQIIRWLPSKSVIDKIYMSPLTEKQTGDYLRHRVKTAGLIRNDPFSADQVRKIHELSGGLPGWINGEAFILLKSIKKHKKGLKESLSFKLKKWQSLFVPILRKQSC